MHSPKRSRENSPARFANHNAGQKHEEHSNVQDDLKQFIVQQIGEALHAFASGLPSVVQDPPPVNTIVENPHSGLENSRREEKRKSKLLVTHGKRIRQVLEGDIITFDDEDADVLFIPHNDVLVISLLVCDTNVKRILIDLGSSINIILLRVVNAMQAIDRVIPKARSLSGFDNSSAITKGEIILSSFAKGVVKDTKFQVVDANMAYNIILGRPWIDDKDAVPSTLH
ncbi:uncharacterized protein [Nicotiana tomentosiformis]|uniref:uncharacterized protein n=1 Tax=Nicotiana tomentosiformis TaxID=4098 RepID=UPI00051C04C8|nr:uncharacterized protein LOC104116404 [Nicotiana tomentosiformis]